MCLTVGCSMGFWVSGHSHANHSLRRVAVYDDEERTLPVRLQFVGRRQATPSDVTSPARRETFNDLVVDNLDYQRRTACLIGNTERETVQVFDGKMTTNSAEPVHSSRLDKNTDSASSETIRAFGPTVTPSADSMACRLTRPPKPRVSTS